MKYNFELLRTYSTMIEIEADNQQEAIDKFNDSMYSIYTQELEECNVIEEVVKGDKYARKCNKCGQGMYDGYVVGFEYYCSDTCLHTIYTPKEWANMYEESEEETDGNYCYWTQWEDEEDYQYQIINGRLEEIN